MSPLMDVLKCSYLTQVDKSDLGNKLMARPRVLIASVEFLSSTEVQMLLGIKPFGMFPTR